MNCQEFWNSVPQRGREITEEQAAHADLCPACAAQWTSNGALAAGLRSVAEDLRHVAAPARVEAGLMAAYRAQAGLRRRKPVRPSLWTPVLAWAAAAAAMILLAGFLVRGGRPAGEKPGTVAAPHHTTQPGMECAAVPAAPAADADSDEDSSGLGDGFIRLPNAARIEPNEDVDVVRVEVPGSAIIAMGIPVSEDRASETLLADVALGPDGMARAVRFVNEGGTF
jgi:hypothetical protein